MNLLERAFQLNRHQTTGKNELIAGLTSYFTVVYILVVNGAIISDSGIPFSAAVTATVFTSFVGCLLMGFWANAPVVLVPGMGINAFFTYTMVHELGLAWQEALAVVVVAGLLFTVTAFSGLSSLIASIIPNSLKKGITVGIGLLITFIGLQKGGIIQANKQTFVTIGDLSQPAVWLTLGSLIFTVILFVRKIKGSFLLSILATTLVALLFGIQPADTEPVQLFSFDLYLNVVGSLSFARVTSFTFWTATFVLTMVLIFENMGLLQGMLEDKSKFRSAFQANAISATTAGLFGTSPTVSAVESATGIAAGGKTGLTAVTAGFLFLTSIFFIPFIKWIPDSAIASILIVVGGLMIHEVATIPFADFTEGIPAFITFAFIPFTYSIPDGIAFGFIAYAILKVAAGKTKKVPVPFYIIAGLFFLQLLFHA